MFLLYCRPCIFLFSSQINLHYFYSIYSQFITFICLFTYNCIYMPTMYYFFPSLYNITTSDNINHILRFLCICCEYLLSHITFTNMQVIHVCVFVTVFIRVVFHCFRQLCMQLCYDCCLAYFYESVFVIHVFFISTECLQQECVLFKYEVCMDFVRLCGVYVLYSIC